MGRRRSPRGTYREEMLNDWLLFEDNKARGLQDVIGLFQMIPQLRGFWPFSSADESGNVIDFSGHGHTLTNNGSMTFGMENNIPYGLMRGSEYLSRSGEGTLAVSNELTFGGWFYFTEDPIGALHFLMGKADFTPVTAWEYSLESNGNKVSFIVRTSTQRFDTITVNDELEPNKWFFIVGRHNGASDGTKQRIFINNRNLEITGDKADGDIQDAGSTFTIGARDLTGGDFEGRACLCFVAAAELTDQHLAMLYNRTRYLFS